MHHNRIPGATPGPSRLRQPGRGLAGSCTGSGSSICHLHRARAGAKISSNVHALAIADGTVLHGLWRSDDSWSGWAQTSGQSGTATAVSRAVRAP
jgi:hypothetical protein